METISEYSETGQTLPVTTVDHAVKLGNYVSDLDDLTDLSNLTDYEKDCVKQIDHDVKIQQANHNSIILEKIGKIKMKPFSFQSKPDPDVCLICQDVFMDGHRVTMCEQCKIYLHYHCQVEWLYYYNHVMNRNCCHCQQKWEADYSTIQIVKD